MGAEGARRATQALTRVGASERKEGHAGYHPHGSSVAQGEPRRLLPPYPSLQWSNAKQIWAKNRPMNDEELLQQQVVLSTSASLGQTVWVYRGSMWAVSDWRWAAVGWSSVQAARTHCARATRVTTPPPVAPTTLTRALTFTLLPFTLTLRQYPWYTSVRKTLEDPAYADWYVKFKPEPPWYSSKCDNNYSPAICSDLYHNQEQSPEYPSGDGDCAAPNCDCGVGVPCGFCEFSERWPECAHGCARE